MSQPSFRDIELLSAYLDGELPQADSARLEARLKSDPQLRSVYDDLRQSRAFIRKMPARRAPRNFTLTPQMAGIKPPLPRAFPVFRLASALAAILLFFSFAANLTVPALATLRAAAPPPAFGMGGGGGGAEPSAQLAGPAPTEELQAPQAAATQDLFAQDNATIAPTATPQISGEAATQVEPAQKFAPYAQPTLEPTSVPVNLPVPPVWLFGLLALALLSGGAALAVRFKAEQDWRKANAARPGGWDRKDLLILALVLLIALLLGAGIYWMATTSFYMPQAMNYPSGPFGGDKGSFDPGAGNKGNTPVEAAQEISITLGMGANFSSVNPNGMITALDFPPKAFGQDTTVHYVPGLDTIPPPNNITIFPERAFTISPEPKNVPVEAPLTITMDYDESVAAAVDETKLVLYWWSGNDWQDASATCDPASAYTRSPEANRISVEVCALGTFVLAAP